MSIENEGAAAPANDTTTSTTQAADTQDTQTPDNGATDELDADGNPVQTQAPEDVEVEYEGEKFKVPLKLKDALLRQSDYTQKTQSVADQRKALEADREAFGKTTEAVIEAKAQVHTLSKTVQQYADYFKTTAWADLKVQDPNTAQQHFLQYSEMKVQLDGAKNTVTQKENEQASEMQRTRATQIAHAQDVIPKIIPNWSPELDVKLANYGTAGGLSREEMTEATIRNPKFLAILHKAFQFDEAAKTKQTTQTFEQTQQAKPVTRVGGNSGAATARTTDATGDKLTTAEWTKRERERVTANAKRGSR